MVDTSVWVDLHHAGLLDAAAGLSHDLVVPDAVVAELTDHVGEQLVAAGVRVESLAPSGIERLAPLAGEYPAASPVDLAALILAADLCAVLLTGDRALRRAADAEGVPVHGVLWLLDELVAHHLITPARAAEGLRAMLASGSRLPADECRRRLARWAPG